MEEWKNIPGYPGYQASNLGNIRSFWFYGNTNTLSETPHLMHPSSEPKHGYLIVNMKNAEGKRGTRLIHRLVLMAFRGNSKQYALHKNDNPKDNTIDNLYWGSQKQNVDDQKRNGKFLYGEKCPWSKLTKKDIIDIKEYSRTGFTHSELAKAYEVSRSLITMIINNKRWYTPEFLNQ